MYKRIKNNYPKHKFIITADALYCIATMMNICKNHNWKYIFNKHILPFIGNCKLDNINYDSLNDYFSRKSRVTLQSSSALFSMH